jgi:hypothetical protein
MRVHGETVRCQDKARARVVLFEIDHDCSQHPAADAPPFVLGRDVDSPEIRPGRIAQVHGNPANGDAILYRDEVAVRTIFEAPGHRVGALHRVLQVAQVEGVIGKPADIPAGQLHGYLFVPRPQFQTVTGDGRRVLGPYHRPSISVAGGG